MQVMTWNVKGMGAGWRRRRAVMLGQIGSEAPDVVALQECAWRVRHQSTQIARPLGMVPSRVGTLGMASRTRPRVEAVPLAATARGGNPQAMVATFDAVEVWNVHLPLDADVRSACARAFVDRMARTTVPIVFCGDINEPADGSVVRILADAGFADAWNGREGGMTFPAPHPTARIDVVMVRGATVTDARVLPAVASDHFGVAAEIAL